MSLRWRLLAVFAVLGAVAIGAATLSAWLSTGNELRDQVDTFLLRRGDEILQGRRQLPGDGRPGGGGPPDGGGQNLPATFAPDVSTQILDEDGAITDTFGVDLPVDDTDEEVAAGRDGAPTNRLRTVTVDGVEFRVLTVHLRDGGAVQIARELTETNDALSALGGRMILITLLGAALAGGVGWLVAVRLTRPVRALADAAEHVAATQDLSTPVPEQGTDEVGRLATSFNTMLGALSDSRRQQQQLIQDASHELRTPLTSLRTSAELLERGHDIAPDERDRLLAVITSESKELGELVAELVDLATEQRSETPFTDVAVDEVVDRAVALSRDRTGRTITLDAQRATVVGDAALLDRVIRNLLDNADKFAPEGTPIDVRLIVAGGRAHLSVADQGPGIPIEDRERVFDRFYRSVATRTLPGSGLGLAIVAQVVAAHGGTVEAEEAEGGGALIRVDLPLSAPEGDR
jgi:two-component system sensor histidine kinase MprB